uniref:Uncharacterized protein n=1 Tax=Solanum lycopersicum TaxID=4081 RepID=A0A3Q7I9X8_SOLLC
MAESLVMGDLIGRNKTKRILLHDQMDSMEQGTKVVSYAFCHTKCHSRAPSSAGSKWNQFKILALKINITIQKPLSMEFCIVSLAISNGPGGYNLNVSFITALKYGRFRISSSFTMDFLPTISRISA